MLKGVIVIIGDGIRNSPTQRGRRDDKGISQNKVSYRQIEEVIIRMIVVLPRESIIPEWVDRLSQPNRGEEVR